MNKLIFWIAMALFFLPGSAQADETFFVAGQAHPKFQLEIFINDEKIKSVKPKATRMKVFLKQFDASLTRSDVNMVKVNYTYLRDKETADLNVPSFRVMVKKQKDPMDSKSSVELLKIEGPDSPFEKVKDSGTLIGEFILK